MEQKSPSEEKGDATIGDKWIQKYKSFFFFLIISVPSVEVVKMKFELNEICPN